VTQRMVTVILLVCGLFSGLSLCAQRVPDAVVADPQGDPQFPPGLAVIAFPSHGRTLDGTLYLASGVGPHGTVLLLHGLPGYESNGDLAQSIRRAGWNVFLFHYRGTWGAEGKFSFTSAIEDTKEAATFLADPSNAARYRIDPQQLVVMGHSFGGFLAGYAGSHDSRFMGVAMIAAVNLGTINADTKERAARMKRWESQLHPVPDVSASQLFAEAAQHASEWDYVRWADLLRAHPLLIVEANDQNRADMEALAAALHKKGASRFDKVAAASDHSLSDHRIWLQAVLVDWLSKVQANRHRRTNGANLR
jgi:uncharacterized protein